MTLRGEHAMRVRQVVAAGSEIADGDPLFDVRPVWMASPETVAQVFPRKPIFDVVVFDEASQCRLEEALAVLVRARRVVIAGDPKQLPPTRFFESALTKSQEDEQDLSEQGLFEDQQADVEDVLGAALNLEIEQCYLDVHYRSQNADLIEFSNKSFYDKRLQAIPGHPRNRARHPPIRCIRVNGVYEKRANPVEAREVVRGSELFFMLEVHPDPTRSAERAAAQSIGGSSRAALGRGRRCAVDELSMNVTFADDDATAWGHSLREFVDGWPLPDWPIAGPMRARAATAAPTPTSRAARAAAPPSALTGGLGTTPPETAPSGGPPKRP
jgi:hypothetical protein